MARRARAPIETAEVTSAGGETVTVDGVARRQRTITAAATVLDIANRKVIKRLKTTRQDWQDEAWEYYDTNPLVGFGADFIANAMSRFRFYIAWQSDVSDWPNEIDPDNIPPELDERAYKTAQDTLSRFDAGQGLMEMARKAAYCLSLPGEFFVVGREERLPNGQTRERFDSYSASEIDLSKADKGIIEIKTSPSANEREVIKIDPERSVVFRVWRPHPRYGQLASTPMRRVLEMCEEQGLLRRYMRGASRSRLNAGILEVPIEWKLGPTENTNDQGEQYDKLADDLVSALMTGIEDEASAATVVPYVVHAPADSLGKARLITFARDFDKLSLEIRARLDQEIASGLDLPDQVLLGLGQVKFRNAEVITAEQAKLHLEPLAVVLVRSWSVGFLYPAMEAEGIEPEISRQFTIWYDAAAVTSDPDQSQSSNFGVENDMISDDAWRRANNYTDEDAPSEEDIARRATRRTANRPVAPGDEEEDADGFPFGLAAAGRTSGPVERLGRRMATAESIVRLKVQLAADTAMRRAFERIGAASRQRAGTQAHLMKGIDNAAIVTRLGMETVIRLGVNPEQHLSLELSRLRERYLELVQAHQYSIVAMISDASKTPLEKLTERTAASWARAVDHSWVEMQGRLLKLAGDELFLAMVASAPRQRAMVAAPLERDAATLGEFDATITVPAGIVRDALSIAGGQTVPNESDPGTLGGVASGPIVEDALGEAGLRIEEFEWLYGDAATRTKPFEPHLALDGVMFSGFDDPQLANPDSFPPGPFFYPGDHAYCQCEIAPRIVETDPAVVVRDPVSPSELRRRGLEQAPAAEAERAKSAVPSYRPRLPTPTTPAAPPAEQFSQTSHGFRLQRGTIDVQITTTSGADIGPGSARVVLDQLASLQEQFPTTTSSPGVIVEPRAEAIARYGDDMRGTIGYVDSRYPKTINLIEQELGNVKPREGWFMPSARAEGMDRLKYVVTHEYGHVHHFTGFNGSPLPRTKMQAVFDNSTVQKALSKYGRTNAYEGYAEAFSEWALTSGETTNLAARIYAESFSWPGSAAAAGGA
jgi:hypothetical protein